MGSSACIQDHGVSMGPDLEVLEILRPGELIRVFIFLGLFINDNQILGNDVATMCDASDLCAEEVSFLARERRVAINCSVEVASADVFDLSGSLDVLRSGVWELNPIFKQVVVDPVD